VQEPMQKPIQKPIPINPVDIQFSRSAKLTGIVLLAAGLGLTTDIYNPMIWGFIVGGLTSILNAYFLRNRLLGMVATDKEGAKKSLKQNFTMRMGLIIVVAFFAGNVEFLNLYFVGAGFLLTPCLTSIDAAITLQRHFAARDAVDKI